MKTILCVAFFASCSLLTPQVKTAVTDCAAELSVDILADVSVGMDTSKGALEADVIKYGIDAVKCAVIHFLTDAKTMSSIGPDPRTENGKAFLKAHP